MWVLNILINVWLTKEYRKNLKQANTDVINQMQQVQDLQQLAQAKATGVYDLGALQQFIQEDC